MHHNLKIKNIIRETETAITIQFEDHPLLKKYIPGQFINIFKSSDADNLSRAYSFSSSPVVDEPPAVTVKKVAGGELSTTLVDNSLPGHTLKVSEPAGRFCLQNNNLEGKHLIFIGGGSGITPLYSMIKSVLATSKNTRITLLYANRNASAVIFLNQLEVLANKHSKQFQVMHFLDQGILINSFSSTYAGPISTDFLKQVIQSYPDLEPQIYLCGPDGMMKAILAALEELDFNPSKLFMESFGSLIADSTTSTVAMREEAEISIIKQDETFSLHISGDEFILQAGLKARLPLPHSCNEAMCGTCKVKLLAGEVNMETNYALTENQLKDRYILLCSSKPISKKIILQY